MHIENILNTILNFKKNVKLVRNLQYEKVSNLLLKVYDVIPVK